MRVTIGNKELELLKSMALRLFRDEGNKAIDSHLFPTALTIKVFVDHLNRLHNTKIELILPTREHYETLDEE